MLPLYRNLFIKLAKRFFWSFENFDRQNKEIRSNLLEELNTVLSFKDFFEIEKYEDDFARIFAKFCNKKYAIGMSSGTAALQCTLLGCGIESGDEVITTTNTNISTTIAIANVGAKPVLVDINSQSYLIDEILMEDKITDKTKAIMPVHLFGDVCEMDEILKIARKQNLEVIEDSSQAHGVTYKGKKVPIGDIGCFSFYLNKLLGGFGNGGIVVTNNKELVEKIRVLTDSETNYDNPFMLKSKRTPAYLDAIQIVFLKAKLPFFEKWIEKRRHLGKLYYEILGDTNIVLPRVDKKVKHGFYRFVIRTKKREKLRNFLLRNRIQTWVHYPYLIHLTKSFSYLGHKPGDFPVAEACQREFLSLPLNPWFKDEEIVRVAKLVKKFSEG